MYFLFRSTAGSPLFETVWFGITVFCLFFFWTVVVDALESLGPEITFDYDERTTLLGMRDGALIAGTLAAASSPAAVAWAFGLSPTAAGERAKFFWIAVLYAPLLIAFCWWCVISIRERPQHTHGDKQSLVQGLRHVSQNRPFIILLISYIVAAFGSNLPATLILYYVEYVLQSKQADLFLLIYFATAVLFLPGWIYMARKLEKKVTWLAAMVINTGAFTGVFFLGPGTQTSMESWCFSLVLASVQPSPYPLPCRLMLLITMSFSPARDERANTLAYGLLPKSLPRH